MRLRAAVGAVVLAAVLSLPTAGVAAAQDRDCANFPNQAEAQEVYEFNRGRGDPYGLDRDGDGRACETLPGGVVGGAEGPPPPRGGVETGAGGTAPGGPYDDGDGPELLAAGGVGVAVLAAGGVLLARRRSARRGD